VSKWGKILLGGTCLAGGAALFLWNGAEILTSLTQTGRGLPLGNFFGFVAGLSGLGAAADLLGKPRAAAAPVKDDIAKSIWATRRHVDDDDIGETGKPAHGDDGPYLGVFAGDGGPVPLRYKGPKHILCFGPPGASKSMGLVVPNLAHLRRSMIVIDPKAQLTAIAARVRATMGRSIVKNPLNMFADELPHLKDSGWNPLLQTDVKSDDFAGDMRSIADAIVSKSAGGGSSKFFDISAENVLTLFLMWERLKDKPDLNHIRVELTRPTVIDEKTKQPVSGLLHTLKLMSESDVLPIRIGGGRLYSRLSDANTPANSINDVIETLLKDMVFLDDPRMAFSLSRGEAIDFSALHREIVSIFLVLPVHELTAQAKWLRMFVNCALRGLYKSPPTSGVTLPPVLMILDEFANLGRLDEILKALGASRDYSIQLMMILQSLSQLKAHYEKEWELFFTGSGSITTFATRDLCTAEYLSKYYGNRLEMVQTETNNGGSLTPQAIPLIRPEDLMRIERGQTVNLIEPCKFPVLADVPVYPLTPWAAGLDPNPYYRG
jgi:type IV secretion system protein VirD4